MNCIHHYQIAPPAGPTSPGRCIKCGAVKEFNNSFAMLTAQDFVAYERMLGYLAQKPSVAME